MAMQDEEGGLMVALDKQVELFEEATGGALLAGGKVARQRPAKAAVV